MSVPRNPAEEISSDSTEVFDDVDKDIQEAFYIFKRAAKKLRREKEDLYGARKMLKDKKIKLDVGGHVGGHLFSTSKETLMKDPVERGSAECWKKAPDSFLFRLVNPSGVPPTKIPLRAGREGYAIYCSSSYGPTFGYGNDLGIVDAPNTNNCVSRLNDSYQCSTGQKDSTFLTGNEKFTISEMEVFGFE